MKKFICLTINKEENRKVYVRVSDIQCFWDLGPQYNRKCKISFLSDPDENGPVDVYETAQEVAALIEENEK